VRSALLVAVAAVLVAACSAPQPAAPPSAAAGPRHLSGSGTGVGEVGSTMRVLLPDLAPGAYAEIETRAVRSPAEPGATRRQVDSLCAIFADEGFEVGALAGWTISGDTARMKGPHLTASVTTTALDDTRVRYDVEATLRTEGPAPPPR
jgi:hypothetical protein